MTRDLYQVLQVDPRADAEVLEAAYWRLARKHHPDVSSAPDAEARMRELNEAYATLRDVTRRATYDRGLVEARAADASAATATSQRAAHAPRPARPARARTSARPPSSRSGTRSPRAVPASASARRRVVPRLRRPWERLADTLLAHRYLVVAAASSLLLTAVLAALTARLFVPDEPVAPEAAATPAVVLVTRVPTAEPTPSARPTAPRTTPASWPPFIYVPVPVQGPPATASPTAEETATAGPAG